tara:strand:- start:196571 stop:198301 length:1731 start_codon:yes stop_codon:yes gene_type:complete
MPQPVAIMTSQVNALQADRPVAVALYFIAGVLLFLSYGYTEMAGSDMWWHVAAGRELLQTGTVWMVDDWSYSAHGRDWLNHEWLSDIIYYAWVSLWGIESLVYWKWLVIVATFSLLQWVLTRYSGSALAGLVCALIAAAIAAPFLDVRPHLYSLLCFVLLLALLLDRESRTWVLALLFLVWVNLHGGFFFGLMALGILLFPWRDLRWETFKPAFVTGVICVLACLFNPSGIETFFYPLKYAFDDSSPFRQLGEWLSPMKAGGIRSPLFYLYMWAPLLMIAWCLPRVRRAVGVSWEGIALTLLTLAMALTSRRFIPLFAISLAVMLAPLLGAALRQLRLPRFGLALSLAAVLYGAWRMLPYPLHSGPAFHYLTAEYSYPVEVMNFVEVNELSGKVYALYNWGGYIHWRTDGALKVFIDGRADTIYDAATYRHYVGVLTSQPGWLEALEATNPDYVMWPQIEKGGQQKLQALLESGRWIPIYRDATGWLLARSDLPLPDTFKETPPGPWRDLAFAKVSAWRGETEQAIEYANQVRDVIPWHRGACNVLTEAWRNAGEPEKARAVWRDCVSYFPSYLLR